MTQNSMTKMKSRWIEHYRSEFDEQWTIEKVVHESSAELIKLNAKPKSIWFVQHVLSEGMSSTDERDDMDEIWSDHEEEQNNRILNNDKMHQVSPVCDKGNTAEKVSGHFRSDNSDCDTVENYLDICNGSVGPVCEEVNTTTQWNDHFGKDYSSRNNTSSLQIGYENSDESFHSYTSPRMWRNSRKDSNEYGQYQSPVQWRNNRQEYNDYGKNRSPTHWRNIRKDFDDHGKNRSPMQWRNIRKDDDHGKYRRLSNGRGLNASYWYNSPEPDFKYNRCSNDCNTFGHRKPLHERRWNSKSDSIN